MVCLLINLDMMIAVAYHSVSVSLTGNPSGVGHGAGAVTVIIRSVHGGSLPSSGGTC